MDIYLVYETIFIVLAAIVFIISIVSSFCFRKLFYIINFFAFLNILVVLIVRTVLSKHLPYSSFYETLLFLSFIYNLKISFISKYPVKTKGILIVPVVIMLISCLIVPSSLKEISELNPIFNSMWFNIHIPAFMIGYLSIISAFVLNLLDISRIYQNESYIFEMKIATIFTLIGLISGSIWAKEAWGSYWSWDPKEIGALIIFILTSIFLFVKNKKSQFIISILTILVLFITYFGLSFLVSGLHSYK